MDSLRVASAMSGCNDSCKADNYGSLGAYYWRINLDSALYFSRLAVRHSLKSGSKQLLASSYNSLSGAYSFLGVADSSLFYLKASLDLRKELKDHGVTASAYANLASRYGEMGESKAALAYIDSSLDIHEKLDGYYSQRSSSFTIKGQILNGQGKFPEAMAAYQQAVHYAEKSKSADNLGIAYITLADLYIQLAYVDSAAAVLAKTKKVLDNHEAPRVGSLVQYKHLRANLYELEGHCDSALTTYREALKLAREMGNGLFVLVLEASRAHCFEKIGQIDSARAGLRIAFEGYNSMGLAHYAVQASIDLGILYMIDKNYSKAITYCGRGYSLMDANESIDRLNSACKCLYKAYKLQGNADSALHYLEKHKAYADSLKSENSSRKIGQLEGKWEILEAEQNNQLLKAENDAQSARLKQRRTLAIATSVSALLFLAIAIILFRGRAVERKSRRAIEEHRNRIHAQSEELKAINTRLMELDHFKQGLTQMIVHDLKTPLSNIIYQAEKAGHELIKYAGQQMLNLVLNILDVQKFEESEILLQKQQQAASKIIDKAIDQVSWLLKSKQVNLSWNPLKDFSINVDESLIERVMVNLLTNAIKFSPSGKTITVQSLESKDGQLLISVTDEGPGIARDKQQYIFEKFSQEDRRDSGRVRSTGLGLAFCKMAVLAHGGKIWVDSEPGEGSTFHISLPIEEHLSESKEQSGLAEEVEAELSPELKEQLATELAALQSLEVYEASEIRKLLRTIEEKTGTKTEAWRETLLRTVYNCNESRYTELTQ